MDSAERLMHTPSDITTLRIGVILQIDAYSGTGRLLLKAGEPIETPAQLERLRQLDVHFGKPGSMHTSDAEPLDISVLEQLTEDIRHAYEARDAAINDVKAVFDVAGSDGTIDSALAQEAVSVLVDQVLNNSGALVSLIQLKNTDQYTYTHCVNVGIISIHLANTLGYTDNLEQLGMGALLHDVGKAQIPLSVLNKPGPLSPSEWEMMIKHPSLGAEMLAQSGYTCEVGLACVSDHHENGTGTGYPHSKSGTQLSKYAMITAIADVYDALTTDRPYRKAMNPKQALLLMNQQMRHHFDASLLRAFTAAIGYFPIGSTVQLSNGKVAVVVKHNADDPLRPVVEQLPGSFSTYSTTIDLSAKQDLFVKGFVDQPGTSLIVERARREADELPKAA